MLLDVHTDHTDYKGRGAQDVYLHFHTAPDLGREHLPLLLLCCLASSKTIRTVMDGEPRTATSTFTQLPTSAENTFLFFFFCVAWRPQRLYGLLWTGEPRTATSTFTQLPTSAENTFLFFFCVAWRPQRTIRTIMDGEPRMATSTFTQLPTSAENTFLFFFCVAWRPQRLYGLLWTGSPGRPPRLSHSSRPRPRTPSSSSSVLLGVLKDYTDCYGRGAQDGNLDFHTAPDLGREHLPLLLLCCLASSKTIRTIMDGEPRTATSTFTAQLRSSVVRVNPFVFSCFCFYCCDFLLRLIYC